MIMMKMVIRIGIMMIIGDDRDNNRDGDDDRYNNGNGDNCPG